MKRLTRKLCIYFTPFLLLLLFFYSFEPYDWFGARHDAAYLTKPLSSMRELIVSKPECIILGDSRLANLNLDYVQQITGDRYTMLGFGGAHLGECIELFWFATRHTQLKKVVFEASFYYFRGEEGYLEGRIPEMEIQATDLFAFTMRVDTWLRAVDKGKQSGQLLLSRMLGKPDLAPEPDEDPTAFVRQQVNYDEPGEVYRLGLEKYAVEDILPNCQDFYLDDRIWPMLDEVIEYCGSNDIDLVFVIPPMHKSLFTLVTEPLGIDADRQRILDYLTVRAKVIDFEFDSPLNSYDENYFDGFHLRNEMKRALADLIFTDMESVSVHRTQPTR